MSSRASLPRPLKQAELAKTAKREAAIRGGYEALLRQLEDEVEDYARSCERAVPAISRLRRIAPYLVWIRIAKGVSQTQLAEVVCGGTSLIERLRGLLAAH